MHRIKPNLTAEAGSTIPTKGVIPMLVLSRKENERLIIDGNVVVTVVRVAGGKVRLGIEAPTNVHVKRQELIDRPMSGDLRSAVRRSPSAAPSPRT
ncbi:MAG TPA: carbon storage regulator [Pirellulaceae bacterium]|nr:carbon storage regulator [Pirellulaceae bacterium]